MTVRKDVVKNKQREERAEQIRDKFDEALLKELDSDDPSAVRAALKIVNDRAFEKIEALQSEIDELKKSVGDKSEVIAVQEANAALTAEIETIKQEWSATVNVEVRKVQDAVSTERQALTQRENTVKRAEMTIKNDADATMNERAFDFLASLVRRMPTWEPKEFFDPEIPKSAWVWKVWFEEGKAKLWCAWEREIASMPREKQVARIASDLHAYGCMQHQREKNDLSPERREFLEARIRYMGVDQDVFEINRRMTEYCRLQPHPLPAQNVDYDFAHRRNLSLIQRGIGTLPADEMLPEWLS